MRYVVLGAGRQGLAIAFDLARDGADVALVDADGARLEAGAARLKELGTEVAPVVATVTDDPAALLRGRDAAVSAVPYRFNEALTRAALEARTPLVDLGGHPGVVEAQLALDGAAREAGVAIVPDSGIAPGFSNVVAAFGVGEVPGARDVRIRCGGLPVDRSGPLEYALLFSVEGLTNEYLGRAEVLRDGAVVTLAGFTECEPFEGTPELGPLEAFLTSGGTSTAPRTFAGRLESYDYKTIRYRGHFEKVRAMIDLGLLDLEPVRVGDVEVVPRDVFHAVAGPRLAEVDPRDLLFLQIDVEDAAGAGRRYRMMLHHDDRTGFTAMEQATGYPTAAIARLLADRSLEPGVRTPERCGLGEPYFRALAARGLALERSRLGRFRG